MSNSLVVSVGSYVAEISPAVQTTATISELGDGPYEISIQFYNQTQTFTTRPTLDNGSIGEQPEFN